MSTFAPVLAVSGEDLATFSDGDKPILYLILLTSLVALGFRVGIVVALAALVVPVLAAPVAAGDRATASRTASALLTWTVALLLPA